MTTVLVTRPAQQAQALCQLLEHRGFNVLRLPLIDIRPVEVTAAALQIFNRQPTIDWLIFISANAVDFALAANNGKIPANCPNAKVAAIGQATARALQQFGITVDAVPQQGYTSEALLALPALQQLQGQRCVIVRGDGGRELLAETLRARGAQVEYFEVYRRQMPVNDPSELVEWLQARMLDVVAVTSAEALQNLLALLPAQPDRARLFACQLVVMSDRLRQIAQEVGFKAVTVSDGASDQAVFKTIIDLVSGEDSG